MQHKRMHLLESLAYAENAADGEPNRRASHPASHHLVFARGHGHFLSWAVEGVLGFLVCFFFYLIPYYSQQ